MYRNGIGTQADAASALQWYQVAADQGSAYAQGAVGDWQYRLGQSVPVDMAEAVRWYEMSAQGMPTGSTAWAGSMPMVRVPLWTMGRPGCLKNPLPRGYEGAMAELGQMYHMGNGVAQDYEKARDWYEKGAEKSVGATHKLGILYEYGLGVAQDNAKALSYFHKAAEAGNEISMNFIGWHYKGRRHGQGPCKSFAWFQKSADLGNSKALVYLAMAYEKGEGVPQDSEKAMALYQQAGTAGEEQAAMGLAACIGRQQTTRKPSNGTEWRQKRAMATACASWPTLPCMALARRRMRPLPKGWQEQALSAGADDMEELVSLLDIK